MERESENGDKISRSGIRGPSRQGSSSPDTNEFDSSCAKRLEINIRTKSSRKRSSHLYNSDLEERKEVRQKNRKTLRKFASHIRSLTCSQRYNVEYLLVIKHTEWKMSTKRSLKSVLSDPDKRSLSS